MGSCKQGWVVVSRVISMVTILTTLFGALIPLLIATHEPPFQGFRGEIEFGLAFRD